ncbi:MAG: hypothetical protein IJ010_08420 [Ruminococcus sp.]|nr:hypothetical protein [Ruminococcus sp.]
MRCQYREKYYKCGNYLEVNMYPVYRKASRRRKKSRPTSDVMKRLNQIERENKLIRILNANFTENDMQLNLSYTNDNHPESDERAIRELQNFFKRLNYYRKKRGLPNAKYVAVTEKGKRSGRYHHHLVIDGQVSPAEVARIWGRGYINIFPLQFDETGLVGIAKYLIKEPIGTKKHWCESKNLIHPPAKTRDGRLSGRKVMELARDTDNAREYEKYYDGYYFAEARRILNDVNGGVYIYARFYRKDADLQCRRKPRTRKA